MLEGLVPGFLLAGLTRSLLCSEKVVCNWSSEEHRALVRSVPAQEPSFAQWAGECLSRCLELFEMGQT